MHLGDIVICWAPAAGCTVDWPVADAFGSAAGGLAAVGALALFAVPYLLEQRRRKIARAERTSLLASRICLSVMHMKAPLNEASEQLHMVRQQVKQGFPPKRIRDEAVNLRMPIVETLSEHAMQIVLSDAVGLSATIAFVSIIERLNESIDRFVDLNDDRFRLAVSQFIATHEETVGFAQAALVLAEKEIRSHIRKIPQPR